MRASVSVLTARLDLPVPSGNCPFGPVPKVRPYGGLAMIRQARLPGYAT
jgi:hypothetical protein